MSNIQNDVPDFVKSPKFGFNIGVLTDIYFSHNMAIQSGLLFTTKGARENEREVDEMIRRVTHFSYFQLPVHFAYKVDVAPGTRVVFHGGPYVAFRLGGSISENGVRKRDAFGCSESQYQPFDWGLGIGVGAEFQRILVGIGWDMGLFGIYNRRNVRATNQNAFLRVGYRF